MFKSSKFAVGVATMLVLTFAWSTRAAVLLEYDFNTGPTGTDQPASQSVASAIGTLVDSSNNGSGVFPTVNTGTAVGSTAVYAPSVANGSIHYVGGFGSAQSLVTKNTAGTGNNNYWVNYYGSGNGFGTGSAIVVFKPGTIDHGRDAYVSHNVGAAGQFWLFDSDNTLGPRLILGTGVDINLGAVGSWNTSTWYVLAASWQTGGQARLFLQALNPGGTLITASGGTVSAASNSDMSHPIVFNARANTPSGLPTNESQNGDIALYQFNNTYLDATSFGVLYSQLIPEPASFGLLLALAPLAIRRGRRGV